MLMNPVRFSHPPDRPFKRCIWFRIGSYEETELLNEISRKAYKGKKLEFTYKGKTIDTESARFDIIQPEGAEVIGSLTSLDKDYPL